MSANEKATRPGGFFVVLDPGWPAQVGLFVGCPAASFTIELGVFDDLLHPVEFVSKHDLAQVVLFVAVATAFALVDILAHGCLLMTRSSPGTA